MRELTNVELDAVSGGGFLSFFSINTNFNKTKQSNVQVAGLANVNVLGGNQVNGNATSQSIG